MHYKYIGTIKVFFYYYLLTSGYIKHLIVHIYLPYLYF